MPARQASGAPVASAPSRSESGRRRCRRCARRDGSPCRGWWLWFLAMSTILYHADACPYCVRTRLVLAAKSIDHDTVDVDLSDRPPILRELNPRNRVPVIVHDGLVVSESEAINEYLDEI